MCVYAYAASASAAAAAAAAAAAGIVEVSVGSEAVKSCKSQVTQGAVKSSHVGVRECLQRRSVVGPWSRWVWMGRVG